MTDRVPKLSDLRTPLDVACFVLGYPRPEPAEPTSTARELHLRMLARVAAEPRVYSTRERLAWLRNGAEPPFCPGGGRSSEGSWVCALAPRHKGECRPGTRS